MAVTLFPQQVVACADADKLYDAGHKNVLVVLPTGVGKCHGVDTPILMHDGTIKKVQDVVTGDLLMGPDSKARQVLSLARGREMLYRVTPVKGDSYVVNESHILSLKQTGLSSNPKYESQKGKGKIVNISVKDYLNSSKHFKHVHKGWRTGVEFDVESIDDQYLPPYLLGLWLGDGTSIGSEITTADEEIVGYLYSFVKDTGQSITTKRQPNNASSVYAITGNRMRSNTTRQSLKQHGLMNNKHIPHVYKTADRQDRLALLAGILDSDGFATNGCYEVVFKSKQLTDDLLFLARSLGFAAYTKSCKKTCTNNGVTGDYFRTFISGDFSEVPTIVGRHKNQVRKQVKSVLVTGITVEPIGVGDYYGFEITGDHLYLLGDFTVTHNTLIKAEYARRNYVQGKLTIIFAHRDVLLGQISRACCMMGVAHTFICAEKTVGQITNANRAEFGDSFHTFTSNIVVASVDTFLARLKDGKIPDAFLQSVQMWMIDESHHLTKGSKWGKCIELLKNATGLGVTATPIRGDCKGLGHHVDGYFNAMSVTTTMFDVIKAGRLTPYKILAPTTIDTSGVKKDKDGDYNKNELYIRTKQKDITGSAVEHYKKYLFGKPVITFGIHIEHCHEIAKQFNDAGIPSRVVSSKSLDSERQKAVADLRSGTLWNLINCDLFGEGFDAPAVMGVIMLRRTESYSLFKQQFGRMLRTSEGKVFGMLIDHVGNTKYFMEKFGLRFPHDDPTWTLDRWDTKKKKSKVEDDDGNTVETITCGSCKLFGVIKPIGYVDDGSLNAVIFHGGTCPECGWHESQKETETRKRELKVKDGELQLLEFDVIDSLIEQRNEMMISMEEFREKVGHAPFARAAVNNHALRQHALTILRHWIQEWCNLQASETGESRELVQLDFEIKFGINIFKAQVQTASQMTELASRIQHQVQQAKQVITL